MNPPHGHLDTLADTVAAVRPHAVPEDVLEDARYAVVDTLAAAAYAHTDPGHGNEFGGEGDQEDSREGSVGVWWTNRRRPIADATFANAYRAHCSDFDSVHYLTFGHPAAISLPPLLALYESGIGDPRSVLAGYVLTVEIMAVLGAKFGSALRAATYHPTVVLGAPASAASCTWMLGGDAQAIRWAMSYAASTTIGHDTHFGSDIKPLQVATCARAGLEAARLAIRRTTTRTSGPWYAPIATLTAAAPDPGTAHVFGRPWAARIVPTRCKVLPLCGYFDPVLAAWRDRPAGLQTQAVRKIRVEAPEYLLRANRFSRPTNLNEARFSLPFLIALLLHHREVTPAACSPTQLADTEFQATMAAVDVIACPADEPGAIHILGDERDWSLPLRPSAADARTSWSHLEAKLAGCGLGHRAHEIVAHVRNFDTSTPRRWRALISASTEAAA